MALIIASIFKQSDKTNKQTGTIEVCTKRNAQATVSLSKTQEDENMLMQMCTIHHMPATTQFSNAYS